MPSVVSRKPKVKSIPERLESEGALFDAFEVDQGQWKPINGLAKSAHHWIEDIQAMSDAKRPLPAGVIVLVQSADSHCDADMDFLDGLGLDALAFHSWLHKVAATGQVNTLARASLLCKEIRRRWLNCFEDQGFPAPFVAETFDELVSWDDHPEFEAILSCDVEN